MRVHGVYRGPQTRNGDGGRGGESVSGAGMHRGGGYGFENGDDGGDRGGGSRARSAMVQDL